MKEFFRRALANPATTFGGIVAICGVLGPSLADAGPTVTKVLHIVSAVAGVLAAMAAKDSAPPPPPILLGVA